MADRVERLTNLLALLLETPEPLSLVAIAGALDGQYPDGGSALRGAFERDKAALRDIGVPIDQEVVTGGQYAGQTRYWIDRGRYELADLKLDDDEVRAIQVAVAATRTGSGLGQEALWKLGGAVADHALPVAATMPSLPELPTIRDAVARRAVVTFRYRDVDRDVEPHGLLLRDGFWYLVGFDRVRGERRTFRVDRIDGGITAGASDAFVRPPRVDVAAVAHWDPKTGEDGDAVDAVVRVDAVRAAAVVREVGEERVVARHPDGAVDVLVPAGNIDAFRSWVLGLLEHAEVLEPESVRAEIVAWLSAVGGDA